MNICVSIGHGKSAKGGYDSGALGGNYQEFKIAREIGKYIGEAFKGYACTADVINYDATLYLTDRIAHVNKHGYDLAMEIHLNASGGTGSEVYYKHKSASGKLLAGAISKSIAKTFGIRQGRKGQNQSCKRHGLFRFCPLVQVRVSAYRDCVY